MEACVFLGISGQVNGIEARVASTPNREEEAYLPDLIVSTSSGLEREPIRRPSTLPLLYFVLLLFRTFAISSRPAHAGTLELGRGEPPG